MEGFAHTSIRDHFSSFFYYSCFRDQQSQIYSLSAYFKTTRVHIYESRAHYAASGSVDPERECPSLDHGFRLKMMSIPARCHTSAHVPDIFGA